MTERKRVAILISGRGSNMAALAAAAMDTDYPAEIALVVSNRPDAAGLANAEKIGIPAEVIDHKAFPDRPAFEAALTARFEEAGIDIVCLAGFMRLLSEDFVERWRDHVINIHPSILPAFQGLNTHERALAAGVKLHGCTVHFVRPAMDAGPIIAQAAVPVLTTDTPDDLAARVLGAEHRIYPQALALVAAERTRVVDERVVIADLPPEAALGVLTSPAKI